MRDEPDTALLMFPTKALAQDQLRSLRSWLVPGLNAVTYDGDTPSDDRAWARKNANVVLTNPEMLHQGILPFHRRWATFLMRLRLIVVDELHSLRGIFGSNVAHVLRRLQRVLRALRVDARRSASRARPSATPPSSREALCGHPVDAIDDDGSPQSERCFGLWQRPSARRGDRPADSPRTRRPPSCWRGFVRDGRPTLAFTRSRRGAELVAAQAKRRLVQDESGRPRIGSRPTAPATCRRSAASSSAGSVTASLLGVAATNALELGIDVGGLDAVVLNGFPGTLASMRQQAGRAGRTGRRAAAVLVAGDDQLDQWYAAHPTELFGRTSGSGGRESVEPVRAATAGRMRGARAAARAERRDVVRAGSGRRRARARARRTAQAAGRPHVLGRTRATRDRASVSAPGRRSSSASSGRDDDGEERLIGTVDSSRVFHVAHPGALYLHQGRQWRVERLDLDDHVAWLEPADDADEYTQTREDTDIAITREDERVRCGAGWAHLGSVDVTNTILAYQRKRASTNATLEIVPLDLPPRTLPTRACWYTLTDEELLAADIEPHQVLGAVHAAEHALIGLLPLFAICDRWDVGGVSMALHPATLQPTIFVYDGYPGGAGIAELAFAGLERHIKAAAELVALCPCDGGCPSCVQSPKCGNWNEYLDKDAARRLLDVLGGRGGPLGPRRGKWRRLAQRRGERRADQSALRAERVHHHHVRLVVADERKPRAAYFLRRAAVDADPTDREGDRAHVLGRPLDFDAGAGARR